MADSVDTGIIEAPPALPTDPPNRRVLLVGRDRPTGCRVLAPGDKVTSTVRSITTGRHWPLSEAYRKSGRPIGLLANRCSQGCENHSTAGILAEKSIRAAMDWLDIRLLRALSKEGSFSLQGIDPRRSILSLARRSETSRVTVRKRLAQWRTDGFWKGILTFPNPDLLGTRFEMQAFLLEAGPNRSHLEAALRETLQPLIVFQVESFYTPLLLSNGTAESARRQHDFAKSGACRVLSAPWSVEFPASEIPLGPRDWQILRALGRRPDPDWALTAIEVGMTVRGLERRVDRLMRSNALFFHPLLDFRRLRTTIAWVGLIYRKGYDAPTIWAEIEQISPEVLRIDPIFPLETFFPADACSAVGGTLLFFVPLVAASTADQLRRDFGNIEGVMDVIVSFPTQSWSIPGVLNCKISGMTHGR